MRSPAMNDVLKVWLYAAASVLLGAWMAPLLYNMGKALAEVSSAKVINGPVEWFAGVCRAAEFPRFFEVALVLAAVILFLPIVEWLKGGGNLQGGFLHRLPDDAVTLVRGQRLRKNPEALGHLLRGFLVVTGLFFLLGGVMIAAGVFVWRLPDGGLMKSMVRIFGVAMVLAAVQEILFRGIAMGIFLRAMRPAAALGVSAVLFAMVHFINPPAGLNVPDPDASGVGFELLRMVLAQLGDERMLLGSFVPLLALGGVLAFARWRTASLWLPLGLHAGWIFVNGVMGAFTVTASRPDAAAWLISGAALRQGLVPLVGILISGFLIHYLTATDADTTESSL
ncbi:MAG: CPBP family intramembrane glutamic endopeptidase [Akkermansiaceae bacterium]